MNEKLAHSRKRTLRKVFGTIGIVFLTLIIVGLVYQLVGKSLDSRKTVSGEMVAIDGGTLRLKCSGEGSPVVLLDAASGNFSASWGWVQQELSKETKVCSYDRASLGRSVQDEQDFSLGTATASLREALNEQNIQPPYVTAGHSLGALYSRAFQAKYPSDVSAMVLIDGSSPSQLSEVENFVSDAEAGAGMFDQFAFLSHSGLLRLYFATGGGFDFSTLPDEERKEMEMTWSSAKSLGAIGAELRQTRAIYDEAQSLPRDVKDLPFLVMSASEPVHDKWSGMQNELAKLSENATERTIENSTHMSLVYAEENARQVATAIKDFIDSLKI